LKSLYQEAKDIEVPFRKQINDLKKTIDIFSSVDQFIFSSTLQEWNLQRSGIRKRSYNSSETLEWEKKFMVVKKYKEILNQILSQPLTEKKFQRILFLKEEIDQFKNKLEMH